MSRARTRDRTRGHGGLAPFLPTALAGCTLWLRPEVVTLDTGVASYPDQTGAGHHFAEATGSLQPAYNPTGGNNGTPCLVFDGVNDLLSNAAISSFLTTTAYTLYVVFRADAIATSAPDATAYNNVGVCADSAGNAGLLLRNTPEALAYNWDGNSDVAAQPIALSTWYVASLRHSAGTLYSRVNTAAEVSVASDTTVSMAGTAYLGRGYLSTPFQGRLADVVAYNRALTAAEDSQVRAYLGAQRDIAVAA